jgi:hypothetical protein
MANASAWRSGNLDTKALAEKLRAASEEQVV